VSRPTRILAVLASAILGLGGGVVTAVLMDHGDQAVDPLNLGVTLVDQACTGDFLIVTAVGGSSSALGPGITPDPDHAHYLKIGSSCPTAWKVRGTLTQGYAAYLGPYGDGRAACAQRVQLRGAFVTRLHDGNQEAVQCLCFLAEDSLPKLTPGMVVSVENAIYVRMLSDLFASMHLLPDTYRFGGRIDPALVRAVKKVQETATLPQNGVVDQPTWHSAIKQGCRSLTE
jgi:hypothetical protein